MNRFLFQLIKTFYIPIYGHVHNLTTANIGLFECLKRILQSETNVKRSNTNTNVIYLLHQIFSMTNILVTQKFRVAYHELLVVSIIHLSH